MTAALLASWRGALGVGAPPGGRPMLGRLRDTTATTDSGADATGRGFRLGYRPELDGLRGVAVATVAVYHFGKLLWRDGEPWLVPGGQSGLDLFFVLSGFLITTLLLGEFDRFGRVDVGRFLWRRVLRLVPAPPVVIGGLLAG